MVIQRWQSVVLLIACAVMAFFSFGDLATVVNDLGTFPFSAMGYADGSAQVAASTWYFFAISLLSAILPLIAIFRYRNLRLQKRLCSISALIMAAVAVVGFVLNMGAQQVSYSVLAAAPFVGIIACFVARNMISSDEKKLRAVDRFRD